MSCMFDVLLLCVNVLFVSYFYIHVYNHCDSHRQHGTENKTGRQLHGGLGGGCRITRAQSRTFNFSSIPQTLPVTDLLV